MVDGRFLPEGIEITDEDWENTPASIRALVLSLIKRIEALEARLNQNSSNSGKPPSSDSPFKKPQKGKSTKKGKPGGKKGHKGYRQTLHDPTEVHDVPPEQCTCGCRKFENLVKSRFWTAK